MNRKHLDCELLLLFMTLFPTSMLYCSLLRHCAPRWNVPRWISVEVTRSFNWPNPSSRTMALGRLRLQQKWVSGIFGIFRRARCDMLVNLTTSPPSASQLSRENVGASTPHSHIGFQGLLQWQLQLSHLSTRPVGWWESFRWNTLQVLQKWTSQYFKVSRVRNPMKWMIFIMLSNPSSKWGATWKKSSGSGLENWD
jgi:hypothetical protein